MSRVLVVADEPALAELVASKLGDAGHDVRVASDGESAQRWIDRSLPDLALVEWSLPGTGGADLASRWRADRRTRGLPIILLGARTSEADRVSGLDAGADDFVSQPLATQELLARVRALLRRSAPESLEAIDVAGLRLEPTSRRAYCVDGSRLRDLQLGRLEFRLLHLLMSQPRRVLSRGELHDGIWGEGAPIDERTVDVYVKRLRARLRLADRADRIETVRGVGYRIARSSD